MILLNVTEAVRRIRFKTGTIDDITNKSINTLFSNQAVIDELNTQLAEYARITKGIQDVYSFPLAKNTPFVQAPQYALRSEAYHFIGYISKGTIFGMDMRGIPEVYNTFRYSPMAGIANWVMPWSAGKSQYFNIFPTTGTAPCATTLTSGINASVTTIPVASTVGFVNNHGRITIGTEKILYTYKDATNFYGCVRGMEMTTAAAHLTSDAVTENNIFLHYSRMSAPLTVEADGTLSSATGAIVLDPCEEHMIGIINAASYYLILKIDAGRAVPYKIDSEKLYNEYKLEILRGYYDGRQGTGVRDPFPSFESGNAFGGNLFY